MPLTQPIRIPMSWPYAPRSPSGAGRDPMRRNVMDEYDGQTVKTLKRPGVALFAALGAAIGQGLTWFNSALYAVVGDAFKSVVANPNSGTSMFSQTAVANAPWMAKDSFASVVFQDKIYVFGGSTVVFGAGSAGSVWSTSDGVSWVQASGNAPWGVRGGLAACVLNGVMYVMGGNGTAPGVYYNDVWSSTDGTNWTLVTVSAAWLPRTSFGLVVAGGGMFLIGGQGVAFPAFDDVWFSADGATWTRIGGPFGWGTRQQMGVAYFKNKIYLVGGFNTFGAMQNDVWSSPDGLAWTLESGAAFGFGARIGMQVLVYNNKLWCIGGNTGATTNAIYSTTTGTGAWTFVNFGSFPARYRFGAVVFRTPTSVSANRYPSIWVFGGVSGLTDYNDVWYGNLDTAVATSIPLVPSVASQPFQFNSFQTGTRLLIKNQCGLWVMDSGSITQVVDRGYPTTTVPGIVVLGGFAYVMDPSGLICNCALDNPYYWPALNVIGADYEDDAGVCLAKYMNYLVAFGTYTIQIFYDAGLPYGSPLKPYLNASMKVGLASAATLAAAGTTLVWVGQTREGTRQVMTFNGLTPVPISTPAIDKLLTGSTNVGTWIAMVFSANGHTFYCLDNADLGGSTLVYDFSTKQWYEWGSAAFGQFGFHGGAAADLSSQTTYLLHSTNGNVYTTGAELYDDAGTPFQVLMRTQRYDAGMRRRKFWGRLDIVGDQNPGTPSIYYSDDDGQTYSTARQVDMSTARPALFRNGASRTRIFVYEQTDSNPMRIEAFEQQFEPGT